MGRFQGSAVLTVGSHAARTCEPRQVRKEATVSETLRVPWERLTRVAVPEMSIWSVSMGGHGL